MSTDVTDAFKLCRCLACGSYGFPHDAYACRACGNDGSGLVVAILPSEATLVNFVTVTAPVVTNIPTPFVVGEVQLAPGVIEEAVIAVPDESSLRLGMPVYPIKNSDPSIGVDWMFAPKQSLGANQ